MKTVLLNSLIAAFLLFLTSCAASQYVSKIDKEGLPALHIAYQVENIEIKDSRLNATSVDINLPFLSTPNQIIKHVPALTAAHKEVIGKLIRENTTGTGTPVKAVVTLVDGYKEFSATWASEKERGVAQIQIAFFDQASGQQITGCESGGDLFVQSFDATNTRMEQVYQTTLKYVLHNCLKSMVGQTNK